MILYRRGFPLFEQEVLAEFFGVMIPAQDQECFSVRLAVTTNPDDAGIYTVKSADVANRFFAEKNIPLMAESVMGSTIQDLGAFLDEHLTAGHDLWGEYGSQEIHEEEAMHDSVIESSTNEAGGMVTFVDPYGGHPTRKTISHAMLKRAISGVLCRETGFLVIRPTDK